MALADLTPAERQVALDAIELCAGPEGAAVDLDRSLELRRLLRRKLDDAGWERAWRLAAEIVVRANEGRAGELGAQAGVSGSLLPIMQEPLVLAAQRELQAIDVCRAARPHL